MSDPRTKSRTALAVAAGVALAAAVAILSSPAAAEAARKDAVQTRAERGKYLVSAMGCNDCHTPWKMGANGPEPDMTRMLSGHPASFKMPPAPASQGPWLWSGAATNTAFAGPWGVSFAANLTPDKATGLGGWTWAQFRDSMRNGKHLGNGRDLLPPMPWMSVAGLGDADLRALFAYLRSLKPVENRVPAPIPPK